ncbi:helix-turn-helix transcriptional regulator [Methylobacterium sp. Leaf112]|uniref:helix-turn-helix transcriptional regulator n=1 Tax=Methylobacterium sp. Leaf112 TaxID=1736258 RepID=UPI0006F457AE|nr:helix-turn-helix domain-containing protein [Methylobacterium sp. Leaf112]KQP62164.1 hypothetical protein ASF52_05765 [Methylobacterium sp. Leaf112]
MYPNPTELRAARALLGWTQEEAAKTSGISVRTLIAVEKGEGTTKALHNIMGALMGAGLRFMMLPEGEVQITYRRPERDPTP